MTVFAINNVLAGLGAAQTAGVGSVVFDAGIVASTDAALAVAAIENPDRYTQDALAMAKTLAGQGEWKWTTAGDVRKIVWRFRYGLGSVLAKP